MSYANRFHTWIYQNHSNNHWNLLCFQDNKPNSYAYFVKENGSESRKTFQQQMEFQQQQQAANQAPPKAKMTEKKKVGEYIDYEEVN